MLACRGNEGCRGIGEVIDAGQHDTGIGFT
jgi:hypothetical protein